MCTSLCATGASVDTADVVHTLGRDSACTLVALESIELDRAPLPHQPCSPSMTGAAARHSWAIAAVADVPMRTAPASISSSIDASVRMPPAAFTRTAAGTV